MLLMFTCTVSGQQLITQFNYATNILQLSWTSKVVNIIIHNGRLCQYVCDKRFPIRNRQLCTVNILIHYNRGMYYTQNLVMPSIYISLQ